MGRIRAVDDLQECRELWLRLWPQECLFDLWDVRECFVRRLGTAPLFIVAEEGGEPAGLLALSSPAEGEGFVAFPGETWRGETWLEQNRIPSRDPAVTEALIQSVPGALRLRYLGASSLPPGEGCFDEMNYLFVPEAYGFDFDRYWSSFSPRTRRRIEEETARLEAHGLAFRHDHAEDLETLFCMSLRAFGEASYFWNSRFLAGFEDLAQTLHRMGMLRVTTVLVGGRVAAVDLGGMFQEGYTLLVGGTDPEFPGVAKVINLYHILRGCRERLRFVDFCSGDFGWKDRFHLERRPLFRIDRPEKHPPEEAP